MALFRQKRAPKLVHSDRGSQYASEAFRKELKAHRTKQSMSRKGDCWDNGVPRMHAKEAACRKAA